MNSSIKLDIDSESDLVFYFSPGNVRLGVDNFITVPSSILTRYGRCDVTSQAYIQYGDLVQHGTKTPIPK